MKINLVEKIFRISFAFILVLGMAWTPATSVRAQQPIPTFIPPAPEDAQSTTGPIPPRKALDVKSLDYEAGANAHIINNVPNYIWQHGCGPTAAGMVIGYWDSQGYDWLINGSAATQTLQVNDSIASESGAQNHYSDYVLPLDDGSTGLLADLSELPVGDEHLSNSIADFMHTSFSSDGNFYGWSWFSDVQSALLDYVNVVNPGGYIGYASNYYYSDGSFNWDILKAEIDAGRPMVLLVDSDGNGSTDHFIPAFGYDDSTGVQKYAAYNTWDGDLHWYDFRPMTPGYPWGIYGGVSLSITTYAGPAAPSNLVVADTSSESITISWQDNSDNEAGFNIYRWGYDGAQWAFIYLDTVGADVNSYTQTGLACGDDFNYYEVSAFNANDELPHASWVQGITDACGAGTPHLDAWYQEGRINAYDWPIGTHLTLQIEDPTTTTSPDYSTETDVTGYTDWDPNMTLGEFHLNGAFEIEPGMTLTISGASIIRELIVSNLTITNIDLVNDIITGGAEANQAMWVFYNSTTGTCCRDFQAGSNGVWTLDYGELGLNGEPMEDIGPGSSGTINAGDNDGDNTSLNWNVANPTFAARLTENEVHGYGWTVGNTVTLTIDDTNPTNGLLYGPVSETVIVADWDPSQTFVPFRLWEDDFELQPDQIVTLTDGVITKSHTVTHLTVEAVDPDADTVSGTAEAGSLVEVGHIYCDETGCHGFRRVNADENGDWVADFAHVGEDDDEQETFNIVPGTGNEARQPDADWDTTNVQWRVPNPFVEASARDNWVQARDWPLGTEVTLNLDGAEGPYTTTAFMQPASWNPGDPNDIVAEFDLQGYDIQAGDEITATVGTASKTLIVSQLEVNSLNLEEDTISGMATPGAELEVCANRPGDCVHRYPTADGTTGLWTVDYTGDFDLQPGSNGWAVEREDDGDQTWLDWGAPNPRIEARTNNERVEGYEWTFNTTVTLEIDDPATPLVNPDYTADGTVGIDNGNPNQTYINFEFRDEYNLKPGDVVSLTDGNATKEYTVTGLTITGVDPATNVVTGTAGADSHISVWACDDNNCFHREETADGEGNWSTDFDMEGDGQQTFDIVLGTWVDSGQWDDDNDGTLFGWTVPNPTMSVRFPQNEVEGYEWDLGAEVTLSVDIPDNGIWPDYEDTQTVLVADWDPNQTFVKFSLGDFALQPGQFVTMTDEPAGGTTKVHQVQGFTITSVNAATDTIDGTAEPGSLVEVGHMYCDETGCHSIRRVTADGNGDWTADFAHPGEADDEQELFDIVPGTASEARQPDADWDNTTVQWYAGWTAPEAVPLVVALDADVSLQNLVADSSTWAVLNLLMEPLFRNDADGGLVPAAATDYTLSPDGRVYTIHLRPDTYWSDGVAVTAQHFVDGILYQLDPAHATDYTYLLFPIMNAEGFYNGTITDPNQVGVTALNPTTLQVTLSEPAAHFAQILAMPVILPVRMDLINLYGETWAEAGHFAGNGPYKLDEHDGAHLLLSQNPHYYNPGRLAYSQIGFSIIPFTQYQVDAYQRGEVDIVLNLPYDPGLADVGILPDPGIQFLGFNVARTPTDNPLVRKALISAIDKTQLLEVMGQQWMIAATGLVPPEVPGSQQDAIGYDYNPIQAQAYLAAAGYPGGVGLPEIKLVSNRGHEYYLEEIAAQWRSVLGIQVSTAYYSWDEYQTFRQDCNANPADCQVNLLRMGWGMDYPDPYNILNDMAESYISLAPGWDNPAYDALIADSEAESDPAERLLDLQAAERIPVEEDAAVLPLYYFQNLDLIRPGIYPAPVPVYAQYLDLWGPCFTLTTNVSPAGSGSVAADPAPNCNEGTQYTYGTVVELTASANADYGFGSWIGDASGSSNPVSITLDANKSVTANFAAWPAAFSKSSPANAATNQPIDMTLSWGASSGATRYEYCYDTTDDAACSTWMDNGSATSVALSGLTNGTRYYWHVRAVNAAGIRYSNGSATAFRYFTTVAAVPGVFSKSSPANAAANQPINMTLSWGASSGATRYDYCYDTTNDSACSTWISNGQSTSVTLTGLSYGTRYYWHVRAVNAGGIRYSNGSDTAFRYFTTVIALPGVFSKSSPANAATNQPLNVTLNWQASSGATRYEYCYDKTNDNACNTWISNGQATSATLSGLTNGTRYYWHVRAYNAGGTRYSNGSETAFRYFNTIAGLPGTFSKSSPANAATNQPLNVTLSWGASSGAISYEYCYDTTNDSACSVWTNNGAATSVALSGLTTGTRYYWHVRAVNASGTSYSNGSATAFRYFNTMPLP